MSMNFEMAELRLSQLLERMQLVQFGTFYSTVQMITGTVNTRLLYTSKFV